MIIHNKVGSKTSLNVGLVTVGVILPLVPFALMYRKNIFEKLQSTMVDVGYNFIYCVSYFQTMMKTNELSEPPYIREEYVGRNRIRMIIGDKSQLDNSVIESNIPKDTDTYILTNIIELRIDIEGVKKGYDINLRQKDCDMYLIGNVIDNHFIKWYMSKFYGINLNLNDKYSLDYMTNEFRMFHINNDYVIKICENGILLEKIF